MRCACGCLWVLMGGGGGHVTGTIEDHGYHLSAKLLTSNEYRKS